MIEYPSIPHWSKVPHGLTCYVFEKYDGSNLRWEWSRKKGWHKFGTRNQLFSRDTPLWHQAIPVFMENLADPIEDEVRHEYKNIDRFTAFTEFFGPNSFAGNHNEADPKELILFDVHIHEQGFMPAKDFVYMFADHPWQALVLEHKVLDKQLIEDIQTRPYGGEGVVCKGKDWMTKIKTNSWLEKVKSHYGQEWERHA